MPLTFSTLGLKFQENAEYLRLVLSTLTRHPLLASQYKDFVNYNQQPSHRISGSVHRKCQSFHRCDSVGEDPGRFSGSTSYPEIIVAGRDGGEDPCAESELPPLPIDGSIRRFDRQGMNL